MNKLVAVFVLLAAPVVTMTETPKQIVIDFCQLILLQSEEVTKTCYEAPNDYTIENGNKAILIYLCCLGYFGETTYNYRPYIADDFGKYISELQSETPLRSIAKFVMACKSDERLLSTASYQSWMANNTTCPAA